MVVYVGEKLCKLSTDYRWQRAFKFSLAGKCTTYRKLVGKPSETKVLAIEVSQAVVGTKPVEGWA